MDNNVDYTIGTPVTELPEIFAVPRPSKHTELWNAVIAADGLWVPVEMATVKETETLFNNVKAKNDSAANPRRWESKRRGKFIYIRATKKTDAALKGPDDFSS
jgi:hypothetical protein